MRRGLAILAVAASLAAGVAGTAGGAVEVRVCAALGEAVGAHAGPVLLVFFSTDCPYCPDDLFESRYLVDKGRWPVAVVGVSSGSREDLKTFLEKHRWTLPVVLDRRKELFRRFGVDAVPFKVLLSGADAVYRDDPYRDLEGRREELKGCLTRLFSR
jgi:hypothetical protein